ncbi:MAG: FHA domain-containing protein [Lachnospiraceae bacterium]|jgi:hypothetical protein|nr:FHA domain-containing protein [Lachnospiraceae bacterium]
MGKRRKLIGLGLMLAMLCSSPAMADLDPAEETQQSAAQAQQVQPAPPQETQSQPSMNLDGEQRIEQVYLNLPEVFVYGEGFSADEVAAGEGYLSQDKLEFVRAVPFHAMGEGITYYVLLDISGSIPRSYFASIKEGILNLQNSLGEKDRLILCTFGEEVNLAADGNQTAQDMEAILAQLSNRDQETLLFEGIDRVAALTEQTRGICRRQVLLVISDGEDFAVGKKMSQEALSTLKDKGLPAYALCIQDTAKENINSFGEFARTSGGQLVTFKADEGSAVLTNLSAKLWQDLCVEYRAASNVVSNKEENFSFQFADDRVLSRAVMNVHWIPDNEAPYLISGEAIGRQQIRLVFSEPMTGLAGAANYAVTLDGREVGVTGVAYDKEDETKITLTLAEAVENGTYKITGANLTDASMEKNPLEGSLLVEITGVEPEEVIDADEGPNYMGIIFLLLLAVVILIIVIAVVSKKKKEKALPEQESGGENGNSVVNLQDTGFNSHIVMNSGAKRMLSVVVSAKGKTPQTTTWELGSSLIVGRASICDIVVDDLELSRQHFCLESDNGNVFITDLGSTNGTSVNGIGIAGKRRLNPGDMVEAGSMKFTIRW